MPFCKEDIVKTRDGWCFADNDERMLSIVSARNLGDYKLKVVFNDGHEGVFDGRSLQSGEVFAPLADETKFADFVLDGETLTWMNGTIDIAPEFVRAHSV